MVTGAPTNGDVPERLVPEPAFCWMSALNATFAP